MNFRLAEEKDLENIKAVFREIVADMYAHGLEIWDDVFPVEFFAGDIENKCLYILEDENTVVSAFSFHETCEGESHVRWHIDAKKSFYIGRFGVNVHYHRRGLAQEMLRHAASLAREKGANALRLFVVDENIPAIRLYEKHGFVRAEGVYQEVIDEELTLNEYGYEIPV